MGIGVEDAFASADEVKNAQYKQQNSYFQKSESHLKKFEQLLKHSYFDGRRKDVKSKWKVIKTFSETELFLSQMESRIENEEKENENQ